MISCQENYRHNVLNFNSICSTVDYWLSKRKQQRFFPTPRTLNPQLQPAWFTIVFTMWVGWKCLRCYRHHDVEASSSLSHQHAYTPPKHRVPIRDHGFLWGTSTKLSSLLVPTRFVTFKGNFVAYSMCFWKHLLNHLKLASPNISDYIWSSSKSLKM